MKRIVLGVLLSFLGVAVSSEYASGAYFKRLGDLPGGTFESVANNISPDGTAVCGNGQSVSGTEAFRWTLSGRMAGLGDLGGGDFYSTASGVSTDGSVVVGASKSASGTGTETEAFRWTAAGGMVGLGDLAGGVFSSTASGVSADGSVVVGASKSASGTEAFRWTAAGGMVGLGDLTGGDFFSTASGVSANGSVVVGTSNSASGTEAFRWTAAGGMVGLGDLTGGDFYSTASGVSANGSVVVGASKTASGTEAFRWTAAGGMVGLGYLPGGGPFSSALSVSADGSIVVGWSSTATLSKEAFVWDSVNGMRNVKNVLTTTYGLNLVGWDLLEARGVSDGGGTIVGYGTNPEGNIEAWIANLEPPTTPVIGVFRPSTGYWYLDNSGDRQWSGCISDDCFYFGTNGDLPAAGDWSSDGIAKTGVFRPATGKWYVDLNGNGQWDGCSVDGCYTFGTNGDMPAAGDWNDDGFAEIGVFRPATGKWYVDLNGNGQWDGCGVDGCYTFGMNGDLPAAGDWTGDGIAKIGVFRPATGKWYVDLNGNGQWDGCSVDGCYTFGMDGDLPVAGDWTGDGIAKIGVFRPAAGKWYVDLNGNGQWDGCGVDGCYTFGTNGDLPVAGPWQ